MPRNGLYGLTDRSEPIFCMWSEPPPAITPVPSLAGRRKTLAASNRPSTWWVIVVPCLGTVKRFFFASSPAFVMRKPGPSRCRLSWRGSAYLDWLPTWRGS